MTATDPIGPPGSPDGDAYEMIMPPASFRCSFSTGAVFDVGGGRTSY